MPQAAVDAAALQLGQQRGKDGELPPCEIRPRRVRLGEMGEDALDLQPRQRGDTRDVLRRARDVLGRMAVKTEARHAGIDLDMHADRPAIGKLRRVCKGRDRLHHVVFGNGGVQLLRGDPEHEQLAPYAAAAKQRRLLHTGDGKMRRARVRKAAADLDGAVPVGVGLHDGHHDPFFPRLAAEQAVIVFYVRQTDTRFSPVFTQVTTSFISVIRYSVFLASFI